jgi:hypothetical protein
MHSDLIDGRFCSLIYTPLFAHFDSVAYKVQTRIAGCLQYKGIRAMLYVEAEKHFSYCVDGTHDQCIRYDGADLVVQMGFEQKEQALRMENLLLEMGRGQIVRSLRSRVGTVEVISITPAQLTDRIYANQYDAHAADSPAATLEDAANNDTSSVSSNHTVALDSPLAVYQSIENPAAFRVCGVDKAHIWPRKRCTPAEAQDLNNYLGFNKFLHYAFDGPYNGAPTIAIRPLETAAQSATRDGRQQVKVAVECQDATVVKWVGIHLKDGTQRVELADGRVEFHSWVEVEDPRAFCSYLQRRFDLTMREWTI